MAGRFDAHEGARELSVNGYQLIGRSGAARYLFRGRFF